MTSDSAHRLILASGSPRRAQILYEAGLNFEVRPANVDEDAVLYGKSNIERAVQALASAKVGAVGGTGTEEYVLGADTVVILDDRVLGKPESKDHAKEMLGRLGGRDHDVITGIAVADLSGQVTTSFVRTVVTFNELSESCISDYVSSGLPLDKAGGYGIQDSAYDPVARYDGCYLNVVGLPMCETTKLLKISGFLLAREITCEGHSVAADGSVIRPFKFRENHS